MIGSGDMMNGPAGSKIDARHVDTVADLNSRLRIVGRSDCEEEEETPHFRWNKGFYTVAEKAGQLG
jgi:hypothetical protein